jgi:hypothetical protein
MVRKCAIAFGILLSVAALVLDGSASTAEACGGCGGCGGGGGCGIFSGCRTSCCQPRCCASSCNSCSAVAPSCSTCSAGHYAYPAPVYVARVPGYGAQNSYAAPVVSAPTRVGFRARLVSFR